MLQVLLNTPVSQESQAFDHAKAELVTMVNLCVPKMEDAWSESHIGDQDIKTDFNTDIYGDSLNRPGL